MLSRNHLDGSWEGKPSRSCIRARREGLGGLALRSHLHASREGLPSRSPFVPAARAWEGLPSRSHLHASREGLPSRSPIRASREGLGGLALPEISPFSPATEARKPKQWYTVTIFEI
jgi:hypothetical protein